MAKEKNISVRDLVGMINSFAHEKGESNLNVLSSLLDYIIGWINPLGEPIKGWKYKKEDNEKFFYMLRTYLNVMQDELITKEWFDAWGDIYMSLISHGGGKGQFFTPCDMCDLMAQITISDAKQIKEKGQRTRFGTRIVVNDCACGSARNLLAAHVRIQRMTKRNPYLVGEDLDAMCCKMSAINLAVHGCYGEIVCHNTLSSPNDLLFGYIIGETNYPIQTGLPSIRPCNDKKYFYSLSDTKETKEEEEITQLTLF